MNEENTNIKLANLYKAGNSGTDIDESDFWLWKHKMDSSSTEFILESQNKLTCSDAGELWNMDPAIAKDCRVIDITEGYCPECAFLNKCSKKAEIDRLAREMRDVENIEKIQ